MQAHELSPMKQSLLRHLVPVTPQGGYSQQQPCAGGLPAVSQPLPQAGPRRSPRLQQTQQQQQQQQGESQQPHAPSITPPFDGGWDSSLEGSSGSCRLPSEGGSSHEAGNSKAWVISRPDKEDLRVELFGFDEVGLTDELVAFGRYGHVLKVRWRCEYCGWPLPGHHVLLCADIAMHGCADARMPFA